MESDSTPIVTQLLIDFGVGMLTSLLGRGRWSTVVIQTPVQSQPERSNRGIPLALRFIIVAWLYIAAALG